ncbi:MAG: hypothetical protein CMI12_01770, partial [Oceanospirillum sp.]|nr:hypothetical protein [Oceanospirillum sp.]
RKAPSDHHQVSEQVSDGASLIQPCISPEIRKLIGTGIIFQCINLPRHRLKQAIRFAHIFSLPLSF